MKRIAYLVTNHSKWVLVAYAAIALLLAATASGVFSSLATQGYTDPNAESARVAAIIAKDFKVTQPDVQIAIDLKSNADAAANKTLTESLLSAMAQQDGVSSAVSYYSLGSPASLKSKDGNAIYAFLYLDHRKSVEDIGSALAEKFGLSTKALTCTTAVTRSSATRSMPRSPRTWPRRSPSPFR